MQSREQLEKRVADLERTLSRREGVMRGFRKRSATTIAGIPLYDIAFGPDLAREEVRGHARGIIAIGDMATGVIAIGGLARGVVALGGLAIGVIGIGGLSLAALFAGGGVAIGGVATGGAAGGYYACGAAPVGDHVVTSTATRSDVEAEQFFRSHGLGGYCGAGHVYRQSVR